MDEGRRKLDQLNATAAEQETKVKSLQSTMSGFAAAAYKAGGIDPSVSLFLADNPSDFLAQAAALDGVSRRQADVFRNVSVARQRLAQDRAVADQQQAKLQAAQQELATQKSAVEAKLAEQQQVLDGLKAEQRRQLELRRQQQAAASAERARQAQAATRSRVAAPIAAAPRPCVAVDCRASQRPGGGGRRLRPLAGRQAVPLRRERSERIRLLRADDGRIRVGGREPAAPLGLAVRLDPAHLAR